MRGSLGSLALVLGLSLSSACNPPSSSSEPDAGVSSLPPLRDGTFELLTGRQEIGVAAIARLGKRIGIVAGSGGHWFLFLSEDSGATWNRRSFEVELPYGLVLTEGPDAFVFARRGWMGSTQLPGTRVVKVGADGTETEFGTMTAAATWFGPAGAAGFELQRGISPASWAYSRFDAATRRLEEQTAPFTAGEEDCSSAFQSADGELFVGACYAMTERCRLSVRPATSLSVSQDCLGYLDWPIPFRAGQRDAVADGQVWRVWEDQRHLFARSLTGSTGGPLGPMLDLGVGTEDAAMSEPVEKWSGLFRLLDGSHPPRRRFVELREGQPHEVTLPRTPCLDDAACPDLLTQNPRVDQSLLGVLPLGDGRYLMVHLLVPLQERETPPPAGETRHLLVRTARDGEGTPSALDETTVYSSLPNKVSYVPAQTELELTCARALSCFPGVATMEACLKHWLRVRSAQPDQDLSLQRFLSTPAGCAGFESSFPALTAARAESCVPQCVAGHALVACVPDGLHEVLDCEALGTTCLARPGQAACTTSFELPCDQCDESGRALQCRLGTLLAAVDCPGRGESCVAPGTGQYTAFCSPGSCLQDDRGFACAGTVLEGCSQAASKDIVSSDDCGRLALGCGTRWSPTPGCSAVFRTCTGAGAGCSGRYLYYCALEELRFLDCAAIGFSTCQPAQGPGTEAHCLP